MQTSAQEFIPILFRVLFGFVSLNIVINFALLYIKRIRIYKLLALFWPAVLGVFFIQGAFQEGNLQVSLAYSASLVSCSIFAMIGLEAIGRRFPWKVYSMFYAGLYFLTYALDAAGFGFTTVAMPFAIGTAAPLMHAFICIHFIDRKKTTRLQKILGVVYLLQAIHCINFALFRMDPGAQLWGWLVAYAVYDMMAILLPSIALEEANLTENERLKNLVLARTEELNSSLKTSENLFKVLIHDVSNPLTVSKAYLYMLKEGHANRETCMDGIQKSQLAMESIIEQVKSIHRMKNKTRIPLAPVALEDCFKEVQFIFAQALKNKSVSLKFNNQLSPNTKVMADATSLTHSVLSNLVSNGIKFTAPNSQIEITAKEYNKTIILEVRDEGPGIPNHLIKDIMLDKELKSTDGTMGEKGSGLGLSIAKSFVDSYGGQIEFDSFLHAQHKNHGTNVRITLDRA